MLLDLALTTPPVGDMVSLAEAKAQVRAMDYADDDEFLVSLVSAATQRLDGYAGTLGRALLTQTWELNLPWFGARWHVGYRGLRIAGDLRQAMRSREIRLPLPPLQAVTSVAYTDPDGAPQVLDPSQYVVLDGTIAAIRLAPYCVWPSTQCDNARAVTITFVAGYGDDPEDVPAPIRAAIKLLVGHWYANREAVVGVETRDSSTELPLGVSALLAPYRMMKL